MAAFQHHDHLTFFGQVGQHHAVFLIKNLGAHGYFQINIGPGGPGAVAAHAMTTAPGLEMLLVAIVDQGIQPAHGLYQYMAAAPAVAAVRSAEFHAFLTPKTQAAIAAAA